MIYFFCILLTFLDRHYTRKIRYSKLAGKLDIIISHFLVISQFSLDHKEFVEATSTEKF